MSHNFDLFQSLEDHPELTLDRVPSNTNYHI
jgi:hypothetical protein